MVEIIEADLGHIAAIASLLNQYRIFYGQRSDIDACTKFLEQRISKNQSKIFLASQDGQFVGFTQLYTSYSSVSLQSFFILNDLYVLQNYRGKGIGRSLLNKSKELCKAMDYKGLMLATAIDNPAQHLYEKLGWKKDTAYFHYFWTNN